MNPRTSFPIGLMVRRAEKAWRQLRLPLEPVTLMTCESGLMTTKILQQVDWFGRLMKVRRRGQYRGSQSMLIGGVPDTRYGHIPENEQAGIDLANQTGVTWRAVHGGTVYAAAIDPQGDSCGTQCGIQWAAGADQWTAHYCHGATLLVNVGQIVSAGASLGTVDNTDGGTGVSTGPHLHLSLTKNGRRVWPEHYLIH